MYRELVLEKAVDLSCDRLPNERMVDGEDDNFSLCFSLNPSLYFLLAFGIHILPSSVLKHHETDIVL
jgi:hypothetical protein